MSFDYDRYTGGDYMKFEEIGDRITGTIKKVREGEDYSRNPCPELILEINEDGDEQTVTAGQAGLKMALAEKRPQVGDRIRITYSGNGSAKPGQNPMKEFTVEVKPGEPVVSAPVANSDDPF